MNTQRFALATLGAFVVIFLFEMLWHGFLMKGMYETTSEVWRPPGEGNMAFLAASQFLLGLVLVYVYSKIGSHISCKRGIAFGLGAGLILAMPQLGTVCYLPIPLTISLMWMLAELLKCLLAGITIAAIYKTS